MRTAHLAGRFGINWRWLVRSLAIGLAFCILAAYLAIAVAAVLNSWFLYDARGYWEAGMRLRNGDELYPALADQDDPAVFRYAPWFAWIWYLLTFLPREAVLIGWTLLLLAACAYLLSLLPRNLIGAMLTLIFAPMLFRVLSQGNVHPLMVAGLAFGISRSSGPIWVGLAASLKLVPILFAAVYLAQRQYLRAVIAAGLTAILWLPALAYGLESYPTAIGGESFPFEWLTFAIAAVAVAAIFVVPARYRLLAASVAVAFASPRWVPYNQTYLLTAAAEPAKSPVNSD